MKKKNVLNQILKTDISGLLWRWVKGVWGSLNRYFKRSLNPRNGNRPITTQHNNKHTTNDKQANAGKSINISPPRMIKPLHLSPLVGVAKFHNIESLTVGNLLATVRWKVAEQASNTATITSVKDKISWD